MGDRKGTKRGSGELGWRVTPTLEVEAAPPAAGRGSGLISGSPVYGTEAGPVDNVWTSAKASAMFR